LSNISLVSNLKSDLFGKSDWKGGLRQRGAGLSEKTGKQKAPVRKNSCRAQMGRIMLLGFVLEFAVAP
jgi:hypothetical protein